MRAYACGVDMKVCTGHLTALNARNGGTLNPRFKVHASRREAFKCKCRSLILEGYERIGSKEFRSPDGGPILIINKVSKFGSVLRGGKGGQEQARRLVPYKGGKSVGYVIT